MKSFLEKWKDDKKYQAKIKLLLYAILIIIAIAIAMSSKNVSYENKIDNNKNQINHNDNLIIETPLEYHYNIVINIDDVIYKYYGDKSADKTTIIKEKNEAIYNYIYQNNEYYYLDDNIYVKTTKEEIYDIISENYLNIDNINNYLSKSVKSGNQYIIYLKDIILNETTDEYFTILVNNSRISIDYTPLMKRKRENVEKCNVDITIVKNKEVIK